MDFWDYLFDNDYHQRTDIQSLKKQSLSWTQAQRRVRNEVEDQQQRIEELENQVGELALLCRSLLTLLREDGVVKPEHLREVMNRIDAADGTLDGKITPQKSPSDDPTTGPQIKTW